MAKGKMSVNERLEILDEMLHREEGVTASEFNTRTGAEIHESLKVAKQLLGAKKGVIEKESEGKTARYFIRDKSVHISHLRIKRKTYTINGDILEFIRHSEGLPHVWEEKLQKTNGDVEACCTDRRIILSFEPLFDDSHRDDDIAMDGYGNKINGMPNKLNKLYRAALEHCAVAITVRGFKGETYDATLHPEYLKQYLSKWYVFGMLQRESSPEVEFVRLPLLRISNQMKRQPSVSFQKSGTQYESYFSDIVGVDVIDGREVEVVELAIKESAVERVLTGVLGNRLRAKDGAEPSEGRRVYGMRIRRNKELERILLQYGSDVRVLSPRKLVEDMRKQVRVMVELYGA